MKRPDQLSMMEIEEYRKLKQRRYSRITSFLYAALLFAVGLVLSSAFYLMRAPL